MNLPRQSPDRSEAIVLITERGATQEYFESETGTRFFSVTQVRRAAFDSYAGIPDDKLEAARVRGSILHRRFFFVLAARQGACGHPPVLSQYAGYCKSMDEWVAKNLVRPVQLEHKSLNRKFGYAGQIDGQILYGPKSILTLGDLKTGEPTPTDPMQLVAYDHLDGLKSKALLDIYIDADGGPAKERWVKPGEREVEWAAFLNALSLLKWRVGR